MKHVYPPRHPAWLDDKPDAAPHPGDHGEATDGDEETGRGPVTDKVRDEKAVAPRTPDEPRR